MPIKVNTAGDRNGPSFTHVERSVGEKSRTAPKYYHLVKSNQTQKWEKWTLDDGTVIYDDFQYMDMLNLTPFVNGFETISSNDKALLANRALEKLHEKLNLADSLYESWAERQQALDGITKMLERAYRFATIVTSKRNLLRWLRQQRARRPTLRQNGKAVTDAWLEYNFGWKPLILGIDGALEAFRKDLPIGVYSGTAQEAFEDEISFLYGVPMRVRYKYRIKFGCKVRPNERVLGGAGNMALLKGFGLGQPLTNLFSVMPFGWALDYFVNVSQFLSNFESRFPHLDIYDTYRTNYVEVEAEANLAPEHPNPWDRVRWSTSGTVMYRYLNPKLDYELTYVLNPLNPRRASYLASVVVSLLSGRK